MALISKALRLFLVPRPTNASFLTANAANEGFLRQFAASASSAQTQKRGNCTLVQLVLWASHYIFLHVSICCVSEATYEYIIVDVKGEKNNVGYIQLNRPKALNALCSPLMDEMTEAVVAFEADDNIGAIVITGGEKAFAAGADIKEMQHRAFPDVYKRNFLSSWNKITEARKPLIAAVNGFAVGEFFEL